ncbi:hemagglutinin repeat-containing protein|uniref:Adhesin HecA family 20-residue repeat-containing protein n=1 Tax=Dendrosporobacter quercicolus TaxID=146817 RepID=A0A1G9W037_9FIRM|nr:hemagglutinin repeat-containing protein [Dendrosporobacter quercicolus]NSL47754.1 hemagglutinin repeat-containing protein [Dendrosporobacter quercicolus DSM 1736]SDM77938.1 adhesin HecA family 20-residue repeat-containing protein [Dendrosporobacter quercicolus]
MNSPATSKKTARWKKAVAWTTLAVYLTQPVLAAAQVSADGQAAQQNRPVIEQSANGVPVVQIAAPSAAGVSRNQYLEFNVGPQGLILNNARVITRTELAGYITGNPHLSGEAARIILNEITGAGISRLNGYTEIAGQKADLIIANPNGIAGAGFGFINAGRTTLTTGRPIFGGSGSLAGFRVTGGNIALSGAGLDGRGADRVDFISRAVAVNAGLWAQELNVVTGTNQVDYASLTPQAIAGEDGRPTVALDVSALGGMYAGKIKLVGTEKGVGVNSQGTLAAASGSLSLTQAGQIRLAGTASAAQDLTITTGEGMSSSGTVYAGGSAALSAGGRIENSGTIAAAKDSGLSAAAITSTGTLAAGVDSSGQAAGSGDLNLSAAGQISATGRNQAGGSLRLSGTSLDLSGAVSSAGQSAELTATSGAINTSGGQLDSKGKLSLVAAGDFKNVSGKISSGGELQLTGGNIDNSGGQIEAGQGLSLTAQSLVNQSGRLVSLDHSGLSAVVAGEVNNSAGLLSGNGTVQLQAGRLDNAGGQLSAQTELAVHIAGALNNDQGQLAAGRNLSLTAGRVANNAGQIAAGRDLDLSADSLTSSGRLTAGRDLTAAVAESVVHSGNIQAGGDIDLQVGGQLTSRGAIAGSGHVTLTANRIDASGSLAAGLGLDGSLNNEGDLTIRAAEELQAGGQILAGGDLDLSGASIDLRGAASRAGADLTVQATRGDINHSAATMTAGRNLRLQAAGSLVNDQGRLSAGRLTIQAADIANRSGRIEQSGREAALISADGQLDNRGGQIAVNAAELTIAANGLDNRQGQINQAGDGRLHVQAGEQLDNRGGQLAANGALSVNAARLDNSQGSMFAQTELDIRAGSLQNSQGQVAGGRNVQIRAEEIKNKAGQIEAAQGLTITAASLANEQGKITSLAAGELTVNVSGALTNAAGLIGGNGAVSLSAEQIDNRAGQVSAQTDLAVASGQGLDNTDGALAAGGSLTVTQAGGVLKNTDGSLQAGENLTVAARGAALAGGSMQAGQTADIVAKNLTVDGLQAGAAATVQTEQDFVNRGQVQANGALTVKAGGKVTNAGAMSGLDRVSLSGAAVENAAEAAIKSGGNLNLSGTSVDNRGTVYAQAEVNVAAGDKLTSSGTIAGGADALLTGRSIQSTGTLAAGLSADGTVGSTGNLTVTATDQVTATGDNLAGATLAIQGGRVDLRGADTQAGQAVKIEATAGAIVASGARLTSPGQVSLAAQGSLVHDQAELQAGRLNLAAENISNRGGILAQSGQEDLQISTGVLDNTGGRIAANSANLTIAAERIDNSRGELQHAGGGKLTVAAETELDNVAGQVAGNGQVQVTAAHIDNIQGTIFAQRQLAIQARQLSNRQGQLVGEQAVAIAAAVDNTEGLIEAGTGLGISGQTLVNDGGKVTSLENGLTVAVDSNLANRSGLIGGNGAVSVSAGSIDNAAGQVSAQTDLAVKSAKDIDNRDGVLAAGGSLTVTQAGGVLANTEGVVQAGKSLSIMAQGADIAGGRLLAGQTADISAKNLTIETLQAGADVKVQTEEDFVNAGQVQANGELSVAAGGKLSNAGLLSGVEQVTVTGAEIANENGAAMKSGGRLAVNGQEISNQGTIYAQTAVTVAAGAKLTSRGTVAAGGDVALTGNSIASAGTLAAGLRADGTVGSSGDLTLTAVEQVTATGDNLAGGNLAIQGGRVDLSGADTQAGQVKITATGGDIVTSGGLLTAQGQASLTATGSLINDEAVVKGAKLAIEAKNIGNRAGTLAQFGPADLAISTGELDNTGGQIAANSDNLTIAAEQIDNSEGVIQHAGSGKLTVQVKAELDNAGGQVLSNGETKVTAAQLDNTQGVIFAQRQLNIEAKQLDNNQGQLVGKQAVEISAAVDNTAGLIEAGGGLSVSGQMLVNDGGQLTSLAAGGLTVDVSDRLSNVAGLIGGNGAVSIAAGNIDNNDGQVSAKTDLTVESATDIDNVDGVLAAGGNVSVMQTSGGLDNTDGILQAGNNLSIAAKDTDIAGGRLLAGKTADIGAKNLTVEVLQAGADVKVQTEQDFDNHGQVQANGELSVAAGGKLSNDGAMIGLDKVRVSASTVANETGAAMKSGGALTVTGQAVDNQGTIYAQATVTVAAEDELITSGTIASGEDALLSGKSIASTGTLAAGLNSDGTVGSSGDLTVTATEKVTAQGQNLAGGNLAIQGSSVDLSGAATQAGQAVKVAATGGDIDHRGASLTAKGKASFAATGSLINDEAAVKGAKLAIEAKNIGNRAGTLAQFGQADLAIRTGALDNTGGQIAANSDNLTIAAEWIDNSEGVIQHAGSGKLTVQAEAELDNAGGQVLSNGETKATAAQLDNTEGVIFAQRQLNIQVNQLNNNQGQLVGKQAVAIAAVVDNTAGLIEAGGGLSVSGQTLVNDGGKLASLAADGLTVDVSGKLSNTAGLIGGNGAVRVSAGSVDNTDGQVSAKTDLAVESANDIDNMDGVLMAGGNVSVTQTSGVLDNTDGILQAGNNLTIAAGAADIAGGRLLAGKTADIGAKNLTVEMLQAGADVKVQTEQDFVNAGQVQANGELSVAVGGKVTNAGSIVGLKQVRVSASTVVNETGAAMKSGGELTVTGQAVDNQGTIYAQETVAVAAEDVLTTGGTIASGENVVLSGKSIASSGTLAAGLNADGTVGSSGDLTVSAAGQVMATGENLAGGNLAIQGTSVDLSGAATQAGQAVKVEATDGDIDHRGASLTAKRQASLTATGSLINDEAVVKAAELALESQAISNRSGVLAQFGPADLAITTGELDNTGGQIAANSDNLTIVAEQIDNSAGVIQHAGSGKLTVQAEADLNNVEGQIISNGETKVTAAQLDNTQGVIFAQRQLAIQAGQLTNRQGQIVGKQAVEIASAVDNTAGLIEAGGGLSVSGQTLVNDGGKLTSLAADGLTVNVSGQLSNRSGLIGGNGAVSIAGGNIANTDGQVSAKTDLTVESATGLANTDGVLVAGNDLTVTQASGSLANEDGILQADGNLTVAAKGADISGGRMLAGKTADIGAKNLVVEVLQAGADAKAQTEADFDNHGQVQANGELNVAAGGQVNNAGSMIGLAKVTVTGVTVTNENGAAIKSGGALAVKGQGITNQGELYAQETVTVAAEGELNSSGTIAAGADAALSGNRIHAAGMLVAGLAADGSVKSSGELTVKAVENLTASGQNLAGGNLFLQGSSVDLTGAATQANQSARVAATAGDVVTSGGTLTAQDKLTLAATGSLINDEAVVKAAQMALETQAISNRGGVLAQFGQADLVISTGEMDNTGGQIAANSENMTILAEKIDNSAGVIQHAGSGKLTVQAEAELTNAGGQVIGNGETKVTAAQLDNTQGVIFAQRQLNIQANQLNSNQGQLVGKQAIEISAAVDNTDGLIEAGGGLRVSGQTLVNDGGKLTSLAADGLTVDVSGQLSNVSGLIGGNGAVSIAGGNIDNTDGQVSAKTDLAVTSATGLTNTDGVLVAGNDLTVTQASGSLANEDGILQAGGNLTVAAKGADISGGRMLAGKTADIGVKNLTVEVLQAGADVKVKTEQAFSNTGQVQANGELSVAAGGQVSNTGSMIGLTKANINGANVTNAAGAAIKSGGALAVKGQTIDNQGTIYAQGAVTVAAQNQLTTSGTIAAGADAALSGRTITSTGTLVAGLSADGTVGGSGNLTVTATEKVIAQGQNLAGGDIAIQGTSVALSGAATQANQAVKIAATGGDIDHRGASLTAKGEAKLTATGSLVNDEAVVKAAQLAIDAQAINNRSGVLAQFGQADVTIATGALDNTGGQIAANSGNMTIAAERIDNSAGVIQHAGSGRLDIAAAGTLANGGGQVIGNGETKVTAAQMDNTQGVIFAQRQLNVQANQLTNRQGQMVGKQAVAIASAVDNTAGLIEAGGGLSVSGQTLVNDGGKLTSLAADGLTVDVSGKLSNVSGLIGGNGAVSITGGNIDNADAQVSAKTDLAVKSATGLTNTDGVLVAGKNLTVTQTGGSINNQAGIMQAGNNLTIAASGAEVLTGSLVAGQAADISAKNLTVGVLQAGADAQISTQQNLVNAGQVQANGKLNVAAGGQVTNAGAMTGLEQVSVSGSAVTNQNGAAIKSGGTLAVKGQTVDNQGTIYGQEAVTVTAQDQLTTNGTIASGADVKLSGKTVAASGTLAAGLTSGGAVGDSGNLTVMASQKVTAGGQNLAGGNLAFQGATVDLSGGTTYAGHTASITATAGEITNTGGSLSAQDSLAIKAKTKFSNEAGQVRANQLNLTADQITNRGGLLAQYGQGDLAITTKTFDNSGGQLAANSQNLIIRAEKLNNNYGKIQQAGNGQLDIDGNNTLINENGQIASNGNITLNVPTVINSGGVITSLGDLTITEVQTVNNNNGKITAMRDASVGSERAFITNSNQGQMIAGNNFNVQADQFRNSAGTLEAGQDVYLETLALQDDGKIKAGRDLTLNIKGNVVNVSEEPQYIANRNLFLIADKFINAGNLYAMGTLDIKANAIYNENEANLGGGAVLQLNAKEGISNYGNMEGNIIQISGETVTNTGTILGETLEFKSNYFNNSSHTAVVAARENMQIYAEKILSNTEEATIYSMGNLDLETGLLLNQSSSIEAGQDITIQADEVINKMGDYTISQKTVSETRYDQIGVYLIPGTENWYAIKDRLSKTSAKYVSGDFWSSKKEPTTIWEIGEKVSEITVVSDSSSGKITSGRNLFLQADTVTNDMSQILAAGSLEIVANTINNWSQGNVRVKTKELVYTPSVVKIDIEYYGAEAAQPRVVVEAKAGEEYIPAYLMNGKTYLKAIREWDQFYVGQKYDVTTYEQISGTAQSIIGGGQHVSIKGAELRNLIRIPGSSSEFPKQIGSTTVFERDFRSYSPKIDTEFGKLIEQPSLNNNVEAVGKANRVIPVEESFEEKVRRDVNTGISEAAVQGPAVAAISGVGQTSGAVAVEASAGNTASTGIHTGISEAAVQGPAVAVISGVGQTSGAVAVEASAGNTASTGIHTGISEAAVQGPAVAVISGVGQTSGAVAVEASAGNTASTGIHTGISEATVQGPTAAAITGSGKTSGVAIVETTSGSPASTGINTTVSQAAVPGLAVGGIASAGQAANAAAVETGNSGAASATLDTSVAAAKPAANASGVAASVTATGVSQVAQAEASGPTGLSGIDPATVAALLPAAQTETVQAPQSNGGGTITLPQNGLYTVKPDPTASYLVETNPKFANYKTFISSDFLLDKLNYDPAAVMKRLGDGFYEQKLVREQITDLTGRVYLNGYDSAEAQYQALLQNASAAAGALNLTVGQALTAGQQAALTQDIVWLVEQEIDGHKVLVPVVYLSALREGDLKPSGAIISADNVQISTTGDVISSGTIQALESVKIGAANVANIGGTIDGGQLTHLSAGQDILNLSGSISGADISLIAGGDITSQTYSTINENAYRSQTIFGSTAAITAANSLTAIAGQDLNLLGTDLSAGTDLSLSAQNIHLGVVADTNKIKLGQATETVTNLGTTITAGGNLSLQATQDLSLEAATLSAGQDFNLLAGNNVTVTAAADTSSLAYKAGLASSESLTNLGTTITAGGGLNLQAGQDLSIQAAELTAGSDLTLLASNNLSLSAVADTTASDYNLNAYNFNNHSTVSHQLTSLEAGNNLTLISGADLTLTGVQAAANTITALSGGDLTLSSVTDSGFSDVKTGSSRNYQQAMTYDETVIGTNLAAVGDLTLTAANDLTISGSSVISEQGGILIDAGNNLSIEAVTEQHEALSESKKTKSGFLSKKTTTKSDYALLNQVVGSTISGESVAITSGHDLTVQASNIVAENDLSLTAGHDLSLTSLAETGAEDHYQKTKKSGLFSGGGLGFTLGSKSEKLTVQEQTLAQIGSTIGSISGDVSLTAGNRFSSEGAFLSAGLDLDILAKSVAIDNTLDTYDSTSKYEVKQSGLSVTFGGELITKGIEAVSSLERSTQVADDRLQALYVYQAYDTIKDIESISKLNGIDDLKDIKQNISVSVSVGSSKSSSEQTVHIETVNPSNVRAGQSVTITATAGDISLTGTQIEARDIALQASGDISLAAAQNQQQMTSDSHSSAWGAGLELGAGFFASYQQGKGKENSSETTNSSSSLTAENTVTLISGHDTSIIGSQVAGDKIVAQIGGDLNIESLQDIESYRAKNSSSGLKVAVGDGVTGAFSKGKMSSDYQSVTEQAGIYAGAGGFDLEVGGNTDLKGAVIASEADAEKNRLSTDTLTYSDIENKAEYEASSVGVNLDTTKGAERNVQGLTPAIGTKVSGDADSTTKSAIAEGTIEVRSGDADLSSLSRDTANSLNALGKIFDKKTVEEQQELAQLFGELAFEQVHKISKDNGWEEGSPQKIALHAFVGAVMADLGGGSALSGAVGAGLNEAVQKELAEMFKDNPDMHQWASAVIGSAAAIVAGGDAQTGASTAASGTKNNFLSDWQKEQRQKAIDEEDWEKVAYWDAIDKAQDQAITYLGVYPGINLNDPVNSGLLQSVSELGQQIQASPDFQGSFLSNAPTVDSSTLIAAGAAAIVVAGVTLYYYNGGWVKVAGSGTVASVGNAITYGPMNKGPLPDAVANTFRSGTYTQIVTKSEVVLYRVYGGKAGELGQYYTRVKPSGPVQSIIDSALNPTWGNTATNVVKIKIPPGTTLYEGFAARQGGLVGGGNQVWIERVNPSWIIP